MTSVTNTTINTFLFGVVVANGTSLVSDTGNDTLTILTSGNVAITADAAGDNMTFDLTTTGVTAATYGGATIVPVFAVDSRGRLTTVSNTTIDTTIAVAAFNQANTAITNALAASSYANSSYTQANTATTNAAAADSKAITAGSYANSAYISQNTTGIYANTAYLHANSSYGFANTTNAYFYGVSNTLNVAVTVKPAE